MNLPIVKISHSKMLDPYFIFYYQNHPEWKDKWIQPSEDEVANRIKKYKEVWSEFEKYILQGICDFFQLSFVETVIEVYVVSGNHRGFSNPLVISSKYNEDELLIILTHELIHRLLEGNQIRIKKDYFPGLPVLTRNHIIVHAALKYIYIDILDRQDLLLLNKKQSEKSISLGYPEYNIAWEIVEEKGYMNLKEGYKKSIS